MWSFVCASKETINFFIMAKILNSRKLKSAFIPEDKHFSIINSVINNSNNSVIFAVDKKYCYLFFNEKHKLEMNKLYCVDIKIGDKILDFINDNDEKLLLEKNFEKGFRGDSSVELKRKSGEEGYYELKFCPIFHTEIIEGLLVVKKDITSVSFSNSNNDLVGSMASSTEVTKRKKVQNDLDNSEELYRTVVSSANDGIILQESSGKILTWNETAAKIFNVKQTDIVGEYANDMNWDTYKEDGSFFDTKDHPSYVTFSTGKPCNNVIMGVKPKGMDNVYWIKINTNPLFSEGVSKPTSVIITFTDITEQKNTIDLLKKSEEKYRTLISEASDGIFITDSKGNLIDINQSGLRMLGYSLEELIGTNIDKIISKSSLEKTEIKYAELRSGISVLTSREIVKKDGTIFPVGINAKMLNDGRILAIIRDESERSRNEILAKCRLEVIDFESEHSLHEVLVKVIDLAEEITHSEIGFFHFVNEDQQNLSLQAWSTNTRLNMCNTVPEISHYELNKAGVWADCAREGKPLIYNDYLSLPNRQGLPEGHSKVIRQITVPIIRSGKIKAIIGVGNKINNYTNDDVKLLSKLSDYVWDIVEKKINKDLLIDSESNLKILNAEKDKFFSIIAHDLRSPFTGFIGLTNMMSENISDFTIDELSNISKNLNTSAKNLFQLLNNLLEWSSIHRGMMKYNPVEINLMSLFQKCLDDEKEIINNKEIKIITKIDNKILVFADMQMLETINRNLISNAVKFSNHNGVISIDVDYYDKDFLKVSVNDNGIGMNKELLSKLFKIQEVVNRKGTEGELSSGIGLLLCKEFVNKHNGLIWAESEDGKGSTFCYTIPILKS